MIDFTSFPIKENTVYIYILSDPRTNEIRYVGQCVDPRKRYMGHIHEKRVNHKTNWIKQLKSFGLLPSMGIIEEVHIDDADWEESWWIAYKKAVGCRLTNQTSGGKRGSKASQETREKQSKARKGLLIGEKNPFYGKNHTKEMREHFRAMRIGLSKGITNPKNKLSETDVIRIRALSAMGVCVPNLSKLFNVTYATIRDIQHKRSWGRLQDNPVGYSKALYGFLSEDQMQELMQYPRGQHSSPLTNQDIGEIKTLLSLGHKGVKLTLIYYDVSRLYINKIKNNYIHKNIEPLEITYVTL